MRKPNKTFIERVMINGKRFKKTFAKKSDAKKWKAMMQEQRDLLKRGAIKSIGGVDFQLVCDEYLSTRIGTKQGTKDTYKSVIINYILPNFREMKVKDFTKKDGIKLVSLMETAGKSPSTINKVMTILKCILKFAVESGYIDFSPLITLKPQKVDKRDFEYWNEEEAKFFLQAIKDDHYFNLYKFALNTGLRRGEICGLQWKNLKNNQGNLELHFNEQLLPGRIRGLVKGHSSRFVPLSEVAIGILKEIEQGSGKDYIFKNKRGVCIEPNSLSIQFKKDQKRVGVKKVIKFHALRHSFASLLTAKGVNIQKVQHLMGHKDSKITERYSHLSQNDLRKTVQVVAFDE